MKVLQMSNTSNQTGMKVLKKYGIPIPIPGWFESVKKISIPIL